MGEEEVKDNLPNDEQNDLLKKELAEIYETLKTLGLSWSPAALAINKASGTLRNLISKDAVPTPQMIRSLNLYIAFQKYVHDYFRGGSNYPALSMQGDSVEYYTTQRVWAEVKKMDAYMRAYIDHQIEKEVNGDAQLKQKILDGFEQAAIAGYHFAPLHHKSSPPTTYAKTPKKKKKSNDDPEQSAPPDEPMP